MKLKTMLLLAILTGMQSACTEKTPGSAAAPAAAAPSGIQIDGLRYDVTGDFLGGADVALAVRVNDEAGQQVKADVSGEVVMPAMGSMAEMRGEIPFREKAGLQEARFTLDMAGKWFATVHVMAAGKHATLHYALNTVTKQLIFERSTPPADAASDFTARQPSDSQSVYLSPERRQLIGVTFAPVERRELVNTVRAFGRVTVNEQSVEAVNLQVGGWVRKVFIKDTGARIKAGDPLMAIYSPDLRAAQEELVIAAGSDDLALQAAAEGKLRSLGMTEGQIKQVRERAKASDEVTLRAPRDGFVMEKNVVEGARVEAGTTAFRIGNLGKIWVMADIYERDAGLIRLGQTARITLPGAPEPVEAEVTYVYPTVDAMTRTLQARLEIRNPAETLKPGMAVDVYIEIEQPAALVIPREAVLVAGENRYVFVDRGEGYLEPRQIQTAGGNDDWIRVSAGLAEGEQVSTAANFLISSEARLQNALPKWGAEKATPSEHENLHEHHH